MAREMVVRKSWTAKQALAAQLRFESIGDNKRRSFAGPIYQWSAMHELDALERRFAQGEKMALMIAICTCAMRDLVMPDWVAKAYIYAFGRVNHFYDASWDDVFGRPLPKGKSLHKLRRRYRERLNVLMAIRSVMQSQPDVPINLKLFKKIGREFDRSASTVRDYFYEAKRAGSWITKV